MARVLIVVAEKGFRDEEYSIPREMIEKAGHQVTLASTGKGPAKGKLGLVVNPDTTVDEVDSKRYDAIVIPGGPGSPTYLWPNKRLQSTVKEIYEKGGVVAAICLAPVVLARAGIIKGRKCTVYPTPESLSEMRNGGGILQDMDVVVDGKVITANGPDASRKFGEAIVKAIAQTV
ncbi:MAG: DJ-1/PfpI family protein [Candidatus Methanomethyliaceae archaeon]|nr:DJ-1/PfpI family protein [Candidatus Methanomethyliaceae archaeon]